MRTSRATPDSAFGVYTGSQVSPSGLTRAHANRAKFDVDDGASVNVVGDIRLSRLTKPLDVQAWFGDPSSDTTGRGALRWIDFLRDGATLALEFDAKGLTCVQLYAERYA